MLTSLPELGHVLTRKYFTDAVAIARFSMREQYKNSFLGMAWSLIQPAMQIAIMATVFSMLMRIQMDSYVVYIISGILPWQFLVNGITRGASAICNRRGIFNVTVLPKTMFVVADVMTQLYTFIVALGIAILIAILGRGFSPVLLMLPIELLPLVITTFSAAVLFAYLSAYVWDTPHLLSILFQSLIWTVPIMYPLTLIPERFRPYFQLNPLYVLIAPAQSIIYYHQIPSWAELAESFFVAAAVSILAFFVYRKLRRHVIYYI